MDVKAVSHSEYGSPEVLQIKEVEIPVPADKAILIRVYAATLSRTDCAILWGKPFFIRFFTGLFKPKLMITGTDFASRINKLAWRPVTILKTGRIRKAI